MSSRLPFLIVSCAAPLVVVAAAWASVTDAEPRHYTAADQALARSVVLRQPDLGLSSTWRGGMMTPPRGETSCANFQPRVSDLVITGDAESQYSDEAAGLTYRSEVRVLQTKAMVRLDWQRHVHQPTLLSCLRLRLARIIPANARLVSVTQIPVPAIARYAAEYRAVVDYRPTKTSKVTRLMSDELQFGGNRAEIMLKTFAPYSARGPVEQSEIRLARLLAARIPAR